MVESNSRSQVILWLSTGAVLIFMMVVIGGITRLTGSGLSMTDWKLISGSLPPMSEEAWQKSFEAYKQFPEFTIQPKEFSVDDYKSIFWWEYLHRVLGRVMGIVFIVPFIYFIVKKKLSRPFIWKLTFLLFLGGLQGFFGWYMVKSGLVDNPHVSHYRLALHLFTALLTFVYTFWLILEILLPNKLSKSYSLVRRLSQVFLILTFVQIIYGAFTAGLKAGLFYTTFPKMGKDWIADGVTNLTPLYLNFIEGVGGVQFVHRCLGLLLATIAIAFYIISRKVENEVLRQSMTFVTALVLLQVMLGIFTLIFSVPLTLALLHQITAFFLLMTIVYTLKLSTHSK